jgi:hypothetical protein
MESFRVSLLDVASNADEDAFRQAGSFLGSVFTHVKATVSGFFENFSVVTITEVSFRVRQGRPAILRPSPPKSHNYNQSHQSIVRQGKGGNLHTSML